MNSAAAINALIEDAERRIAALRAQIAVEEQFIAALRERPLQAGTGVVVAGSIPDRIAKALRAANRPLSIREIVQAIAGKKSERSALTASVMTALNRRADLFVRVSRGVYTLRRTQEDQT